MADAYLLSVCIPTYNRHDFLRLCLDRLTEQIGNRTDIEIIVVDNASSDDTRLLLTGYAGAHPYLKAHFREKTIDAPSQFADTLLRATGHWAVYLADDDWLDVGTILDHIKRVALLDCEVAAIYCDWLAWDDASDRELHRYFKINGERIFNRSDRIQLLNFVLQNGVLPEIGIYRVALMREAFINGVATGDFYQNLLGLHRTGTVVFRDPPFYRENRVVKPHLHRESWANMEGDAGNSQLELLRSQTERFSMAMLGTTGISDDNVLKVSKLIGSFLVRRMLVWRKRALANYNWNKALEFDARVRLWNPALGLKLEDSTEMIGLKSLIVLAVLQNLIKALTSSSVSLLAVSNKIRREILDCIQKEVDVQQAKLRVTALDFEVFHADPQATPAYLAVSPEEQKTLAGHGVDLAAITDLNKLIRAASVGLNLPTNGD